MSNCGTARTVNNYKMPFSVMELLVTGELCMLLENESTKWIPALPNTFWKLLQIFIFESRQLCLFPVCFLCLFFSRILRKNTGIEETECDFWNNFMNFSNRDFPLKFGSSPHIKIRQSMLDSASRDERSLPTCRCSVKRISQNSFVCVV